MDNLDDSSLSHRLEVLLLAKLLAKGFPFFLVALIIISYRFLTNFWRFLLLLSLNCLLGIRLWNSIKIVALSVMTLLSVS